VATGGSSSGGAGAGGTSGSGGMAGATAGGGSSGTVLFHDDFDSENPAWHFDQGDPSATYVYEGGGLRVTGASLQAFGTIDKQASWGDDYEVEIVFRIESGLVGGAMVRTTTSTWDGLNCNLRNDYDQLRVAKHESRTYLTLGSADTPVDPGVDYTVRAVASGDTLHCYQEGGPDVLQTAVPFSTGTVGFYVYQGTVRFESFEVRKITPL
jgi:hypothetical protein